MIKLPILSCQYYLEPQKIRSPGINAETGVLLLKRESFANPGDIIPINDGNTIFILDSTSFNVEDEYIVINGLRIDKKQ